MVLASGAVNIANKRWRRRDVLRTGALTALAGIATSEAAQLPQAEPLRDTRISLVTTTESKPWQNGVVLQPAFGWETLNLNVGEPADATPPMVGFGGCFNELGWTSLQALTESDRESVLHELFHPTSGAPLYALPHADRRQ